MEDTSHRSRRRSNGGSGRGIARHEDLLLLDLELLIVEDAVGLQLRDQFIKLLDLLLRQRRRWLVHDHHAGIDGKRAGNGHHMSVGDAELGKPMARIDARAAGLRRVWRCDGAVSA